MTISELEKWEERIFELVQSYGLNPYPQEFEICDHFEMIGYMAYSGMPARYPHWSFGKSYEREKMMYDYGVGGLPYEMVINTKPCLAYLMRDNTDLLQILTMAHVYGHNDFFANNFTFKSGIDAQYVIDMFRNHAARIRQYIEDPSIGQCAVEDIIDAAHALSLQRSKNYAIKELTPEEEEERLIDLAQPAPDPWENIHPKPVYIHPALNKIPLSPDPNLLKFIARYSPTLQSWQKDILSIVDEESYYFIPQIETKIMNEGWASYWHHKILNALNLSQEHQMEFLIRHNQVLRPTPGGLNPYHLGFVIWHDIETREKLAPPTFPDSSENNSPGRKKIFQVRETDRDSSFLRRFLTKDIIRELDLFRHEKRGKDRVITEVADENNWETVKKTLITNVGMGSIPTISVIDADFGQSRTLYLRHEYDERELQLDYAERTLSHLKCLWGREVVLETTLNGHPTLLKFVDNTLKTERIN
ncbi:MAG: SpoVR family protein [Deltaproteobacteria bacterium]|nr:SpoVR family protein [Deltaproteobacteria bacterium]